MINFVKDFRFKCPLDDENLLSLRRFMCNFELEDYSDFNEMYDAILISMRSVSEECKVSDNPEEVIRRRYRNL
jgi:hypothetical protein